MRRSCDPRVLQDQSVPGGNALRLRGESGPVQRAVEEVPGFVAGEHASRSIRAVGTGGQPHDEKAGRRIAEGRYRFPPILLVPVSASLHTGDLATMRHQSLAECAVHNLAV